MSGSLIWYQVTNADEQVDKIRELIEEARGDVRIGILYRHNRDLEQGSDQAPATGCQSTGGSFQSDPAMTSTTRRRYSQRYIRPRGSSLIGLSCLR